jgi:flagellar biosynthetic protein FlhB
MAAVMIGGAVVMFISGPAMVTALVDLMRRGLTIDPAHIQYPGALVAALSAATWQSLAAIAPLLVVVMLAAIAGGVALGGWAFSATPLAPKLSKLDPLKGLQRVFGLKGLVEVAKALGKAGIVAAAAAVVLYGGAQQLLNLNLMPLPEALGAASVLMTTVFMVACVSLLVIALFDVPFQMWNHQKELRMTRKEVQDELKESEGRPEVKNRVRALQQEIANRRMLRDVPDADVIVTNPEHFAVALRYDDGKMSAPVVVASGVDFMAAKIREIAAAHNVPVFAAPPLARALYWSTPVGSAIPEKLYVAVAQVLTYVLRLKAYSEGSAPYPDRPAVAVDSAYLESVSGADR